MTTTAPAVALGRYDIDIQHSTITFATRHLFGLAGVRGSFVVRTGTVDVAEPLTASAVRAEIDAASFTTGNKRRDQAVRSARFLHIDRYPVLGFTSTGFVGGRLDGELTVREVTRPVSLAVEVVRSEPGSFTARGTVRIDRTDFGVTASRGLAGRYLDLSLDIRCVRA